MDCAFVEWLAWIAQHENEANQMVGVKHWVIMGEKGMYHWWLKIS